MAQSMRGNTISGIYNCTGSAVPVTVEQRLALQGAFKNNLRQLLQYTNRSPSNLLMHTMLSIYRIFM